MLARPKLPTVAAGATGQFARCVICLEGYKFTDRRTFLPCLHSFHKHCIGVWLKRSDLCPECQLNVRKLLATSQLQCGGVSVQSKNSSSSSQSFAPAAVLRPLSRRRRPQTSRCQGERLAEESMRSCSTTLVPSPTAITRHTIGPGRSMRRLVDSEQAVSAVPVNQVAKRSLLTSQGREMNLPHFTCLYSCPVLPPRSSLPAGVRKVGVFYAPPVLRDFSLQ